MNRKLFKCPDFNDKKVKATFEHVVRLYKSEIGKPIRYAYKLTDKVMTPNGIEKTSVKLADALFHISTIEGLKVYGEKECPDFLLTASFLEIIRDWWDSFNVKAPDIGFEKRDPNRHPINSENMEQKHDDYKRLLDWLNSWQQNCKKNKEKHNGLSDETFLTLKQTTKCMISLSKYLLH